MSWRLPTKASLKGSDNGGDSDEERRAAKRGRGDRAEGSKKKTTKDKLDKLVEAVARLSLANTQAIQELQAATFRTYLVPANKKSVKASKKTIKQYIEIVQKEGPEHKRGPIHVQAAMGFLEGMLEETTDEDDKKQLEDWAKGLEAEEMVDVCEVVTVFRVTKTFKSDTMKVQMQIHDSDIMKLWHTTLLKQGAKLKLGTSPKTELQRTIQKALDQLND
jgi:hypothetical protein